MAYPQDFGTIPEAAPNAAGPGAVLGWLGAVMSVALIAGLGVWVYDLATRDARAVPVVRAMDGPARIAPEDPGGFEAAHQGFEVNRIASEEAGAPLSERVVLAPEPEGPAPGDLPVGAPSPRPAQSTTGLRDAVQGVLSEVLGTPAPRTGPETAAPSPPAGGAAPRPRKRPDLDIVTRADPAALRPALAAVPVEVAPTDIPAGTRLVQLGAFDSREAALERWSVLEGRFSDYLTGHARVVEPVQIDGQTVHRLRAHRFDDLDEARAFCAVLLAEKADCIPVLTR